jgi:hypothetical protein
MLCNVSSINLLVCQDGLYFTVLGLGLGPTWHEPTFVYASPPRKLYTVKQTCIQTPAHMTLHVHTLYSEHTGNRSDEGHQVPGTRQS